jgi:hypothetical protein
MNKPEVVMIQHTVHSATRRAFLVKIAAVGQKSANSANSAISPNNADSTISVALHSLRNCGCPQDRIREVKKMRSDAETTNVAIGQTEYEKRLERAVSTG